MTRLHIGCGANIMPGWVNVDNQAYPGVDTVLDVRHGLPFADVSHIFAEHFIEHLDYDEGVRFMRECRRVLTDDGVLRLSTPNLDWVWASHYRRVLTEQQAILGCFGLNRAFRGWGHRFLFNEHTLTASLLDAGFATVTRHLYGESGHDLLRGIERHEQVDDYDGLSHILIVEASGRGGTAPAYLQEPRDQFLRDAAIT